jgi:hypothetical protein
VVVEADAVAAPQRRSSWRWKPMPSPRLGGRGGGNRRHRRAMEVMEVMEEAGTELMVVEADAMEEVDAELVEADAAQLVEEADAVQLVEEADVA